jgi:hypothetical protein
MFVDIKARTLLHFYLSLLVVENKCHYSVWMLEKVNFIDEDVAWLGDLFCYIVSLSLCLLLESHHMQDPEISLFEVYCYERFGSTRHS